MPLGRFLNDRGRTYEPASSPEEMVELYSVPSFERARPQIIRAGEVGSTKQCVEPGDVLLCKINPRINRAWVVGDHSPHRKIASTEWIRFGSSAEIFPDFLRRYLSTEWVRSHLALNVSGVGGSLMRVKGSTVAGFPIPVPPIPVQHIIVDRIHELFVEIDEGEAALAEARTGIESYRKSLLKAAVTGELTADWRWQNPTRETGAELLQRILGERRTSWHADPKNVRKRYIEPAGPNTDGLPELPEGWTWTTIGILAEVTGGLTQNSKRAVLPQRLPFLRVANVYENRLDLRSVEVIGVSDAELERVRLRRGDLLVVEGNGSIEQIGRSCVWDGSIDPCVHQNHLIKARFGQHCLSAWTQTWLRSPYGRRELESQASSTSGLHTLSISKVEGIRIPLPSLAEITRILEQERAARETLADSLNSYRPSTTLRQSILAAAFRGELTT